MLEQALGPWLSTECQAKVSDHTALRSDSTSMQAQLSLRRTHMTVGSVVH